jgi:apolipoprotein N-acyltransferase
VALVLLRLLIAVTGGLALSVAFPPIAWAPLALLGLAFFVLATADLRFWQAGAAGLVFGIGFYFPHIRWMAEAVGTDAWIALASIEAL